MSILRTKSSIALIILIFVMLLLIPLWYIMVAPMMIESELEKIDMTTSYEGTLWFGDYGLSELPIRIEAHAYVEKIKGDNVFLRTDVKMMNMTNPDEPNTLDEFTGNLTYVFNKKTLENVPDAPDADKNRTGYDPLYPLHLKAGENITNVWLENLNSMTAEFDLTTQITATLEFSGSIEEGVTLYKYHVNETIMKYSLEKRVNVTFTSTRTVLIEPLSGLLAYTEIETLDAYIIVKGLEPFPVIHLKYSSSPEAKAQGIADAKTMHSDMQLLELYLPTILGVIAIVLTLGLAFNVRRLRKKLPKSKK